MNHIFERIVDAKLHRFVNDYRLHSKNVFLNQDGRILHPGEFGGYRERVVAETLKPFLPERLGVGTGFVITPKNRVSSQCDIIIYDKEHTPVIESNEQRFFTVETVVGVLEVKSTISNKKQLKEALQKLSGIKRLREDVSPDSYIERMEKTSKNRPFDARKNLGDQMMTMLVCDGFRHKTLSSYALEFYNYYTGIDRRQWHNMVLSISDGCSLYHVDEEASCFPFIPDIKTGENKSRIAMVEVSDEGYQYEHILQFFSFLHMVIGKVSVAEVDLGDYLGRNRAANYLIGRQ